MLPIGTKVYHLGHGLGEVIARNDKPQNSYLEERPLEALKQIMSPELVSITGEARLISALASSFYNADRYPNVIKFNSGYKDVYADCEVNVIN